MTTLDVMLDIETLGTAPGSVVLAIGAACEGDQFYAQLPVLPQIFLGLTIDADTMSWWRKQDPVAWASSTQGSGGIADALVHFSQWLAKLRRGAEDQPTGNKIRVWGDSCSFDCGLLACVYRAAGVLTPWAYSEEYCYRTLRQLRFSEKPKAKLQHNALDDARAQFVHLQELLNEHT